MQNRNKFIVIEGIDGSGKTTVSKLLSEKLNALMYKTPSWPFSDWRDVIDKTVDIKSRFYFYLSCVIHASTEIEKLLENKNVVCDRYILSTLCYHRASDSFFINFDENQLDILFPDYTFFLDAGYEVRMKRIAARENANNSDVIKSRLHDREYQGKVQYEFSKYKDLLWINTNKASPEIIADIIYKKLAEKQESK